MLTIASSRPHLLQSSSRVQPLNLTRTSSCLSRSLTPLIQQLTRTKSCFTSLKVLNWTTLEYPLILGVHLIVSENISKSDFNFLFHSATSHRKRFSHHLNVKRSEASRNQLVKPHSKALLQPTRLNWAPLQVKKTSSRQLRVEMSKTFKPSSSPLSKVFQYQYWKSDVD